MKLSCLVPLILLVADSAFACQSMEDGAEIIKGEVKFIKNCHAKELHDGKEILFWHPSCQKQLKYSEENALRKNKIKKGEYCIGKIKHDEKVYDVYINIPCPEIGTVLKGELQLKGCLPDQFFVKPANEKENSKSNDL